MVTVAPRYQFLQQAHEIVQPRGYLEIGVQHGGSLALAQCPAVGIDPTPMVITPLGDNHTVIVATSDHFFNEGYRHDILPRRIDLAFIDGMHLVEYALRDFMNVESHCHSKSVILLDDVLPYNAFIATRDQPPGDWTGDVWKMIDILQTIRNDLSCVLVDTHPTGTLMVFNVNPENKRLNFAYDDIVDQYAHEFYPVVPQRILTREGAVSMAVAADLLERFMNE